MIETSCIYTLPTGLTLHVSKLKRTITWMHVFVVLVSCATAIMAMAVKKNQILCIYNDKK